MRFISNYIFFLFFLICPWVCFTQNALMDSLVRLVKNDKEDTNKIVHLNDLGWEYKGVGNYDTCLYYTNIALQLADQILKQNDAEQNDPKMNLAVQKGIASSYGNIRSVYYNKGQYPRAIEYALKALKIFEKINDKKGIATILGNVGIIYWQQGDYPKALDYYFKALKISEDIGDKTKTAAFLGNIGIVYYEQADYPKALDYYFKALKIKEELGNKNGIANTLGNIGIVYNNMGSSEKPGPEKEELNQKALDHYFKALKLSNELEDKNSISAISGNIGGLLTEQKKYREAYGYIYKAISLSDSIGALDNVKRMYMILSTLYEKSTVPLEDTIGGNLLNMEQMRLRALYYHKRYIAVRDTLFSEENKKQLVRKEMNFEFEKKEAAAKAEQDKKDAVAIADARRQKIVLILVSFVLLLVAAVAFIVFRSLKITRRQKTLIEKQKQSVEEHQKEILDSIYYARRIQRSLLPTEKYITKSLLRLMKN